MRTVLINHLLEPPGRVTGITRFLFALLPALLGLTDDQYVLVTCWSEADLPQALLHPRLRVITRRFWKSTALNVLMQNATLPGLMRQTGASIEFNGNPIGGWIGSWPRILTVHDLYLKTLPKAYPLRHRLVWDLVFPLAARSARHIVVPSSSTKEDLIRAHAQTAGKIEIIPEAPAFTTSAAIASAPIAGRYGLMVGNLSPNKNPSVVIEALALLAARGLRAPLLHIGRDEHDLLRTAVARHPEIASVTSIHGVDDEMLRAAYAHAGFFINSSLHEGFCLPVVEAQSLGAPVIASNRSALPEVAGDGALFIDPTSPTEIADAIALIWTDAAAEADLRRRSRQNAERFSWERAAEMLANLFDEATPRKKSPRLISPDLFSAETKESLHA
ncbi:glycosyltransferase family 1 protein [Terrarubrum flagellatum]|uniref:glycosyltransferase family 4 protein n=1 Tax=Terrirubrum flagellatum TaxID=2895980 RepID=UPI0031453F0A